jgi:hypothetical protein
MSRTLHIGFFKHFLGQDTILFSGTAEAMSSFHDVLQDLASGCRGPTQLESLAFAQAHGGISILASRSCQSRGLRPVATNSPTFAWEMRAEDWENVSSLVEPLRERRAAHQFLDYPAVSDVVQVVVSANEYDEGWWRGHG